MIRTMALGVLFLAGAGAIGPLARDTAPKPSKQLGFPVAVGTRADRLPITIRQISDMDVLNADQLHPLFPQHQRTVQANADRPSEEPRIVSRHWHDPTDLKLKKVNHSTANPGTSQLSKRAADANARQIVEAKDCRSDGLYPLLRKMNLSPPCT
ncbi:hypothetical protein L6654_41445 [Bradyrhizobium sp. WYCCWR 13023]|uniref:Uncharacterized protein n=1 Tax=Bradyrhizobium zhengyangense TaxID=2911009 RepID=A0A9X1UF17_9BRAD|nr:MULTISPECIES: hypothetical protein [Bradyrhizobium]MCG2633029.1 hypothetical protein [Bradyrhizobium zhengyangense]MCG2673227.1 hypothetical protein [Bradyrhizobium zhengyangense]